MKPCYILRPWLFSIFIVLLSNQSYASVQACITAPPHTITGGVVYICKWENLNLSGANCLGNTTPIQEQYSWINLSNPSVTSGAQNFFTQDTGKYELTLTNLSDGSWDRDTVWVRFFNTPNTFVINGNATLKTKCESENISLTVPTIAGLSNYQWWIESNPVAVGTGGTLNIGTTISSSQTNYIATSLHTASGCTLMDTISVFTFATPTPNLGVDTNICVGESVTVSPKGLPPGTYQWSWNGGAWTSTTSLTVSTTQNVSLTIKGPFPNPCSGSDSRMVTVNPNPSVSTGGPISICPGGHTTLAPTVSNTTTGPYSYVWTPSTGLDNSTSATPVATLSSNQTYNLEVTVVNTGCKGTTTKTVNIDPSLNPVVTAGPAVNICPGGFTTLGETITNAIGPYTYIWTPSTGLDNNTSASPVATLTSNQVYNLEVTVTNTGCKGYTTKTVNVDPTLDPVVTAGPAVTICPGASTTLSATITNATGPYSYRWSPFIGLNDSSSATPVASPASDQTYNLQITTTGGCKGYTTKTVLVNPPLSASVLFTDSTICSGESIILQTYPAGGTAPYTYSWSGPSIIGSNIKDTVRVGPGSGGSYSVTITDSKNCKVVPQTINIDMLWVNLGRIDTIALSGTTIVMEASNPSTQGFSFRWKDPSNNYVGYAPSYGVPSTSPGIYTVEVYNPATGCFVTDNKETFFTEKIVEKVYVPTAFSPEHEFSDLTDPRDREHNQNLRVYGNNISNKNFLFRVYNKWGEIVYQATNFEEANLNGWNGTKGNTGDPLNSGVYTYTVQGEFFDGGTFKETGTSSLIR